MTRDGMTMYERAMFQKEERERKLKALQETLMSDFTFSPRRVNLGKKSRPRAASGGSIVSSMGDSPSTLGESSLSIFPRLYTAGTAASRAQQHIPENNNNVGYARAPLSTGASTAGRSYHTVQTASPRLESLFKAGEEKLRATALSATQSSYTASGSRTIVTTQTASPRVESLFKAGEEKLRARYLSDKDEAEQLKRRIEKDLLNLPGVYTFRPQTKWDLVARRREMALRAKEREEDQSRRTMRNILKAESKQEKVKEEFNDEEYTFKPNLNWDIVKERRKLAHHTPEKEETKKFFFTRSEREKLERDLRYEEIELKECTFKPKTNWSKTSEASNVDGHIEENIESAPVSPIISPKFVSSNDFSEGVGKDTRVRTIFRRNIAGNIEIPKSPQWKKKFREIGQKSDLEEEVIGQGQGGLDTVVRGHTLMPTDRFNKPNFETDKLFPSIGMKNSVSISGTKIDDVRFSDEQRKQDEEPMVLNNVESDELIESVTQTKKASKWLDRLSRKGKKKSKSSSKKEAKQTSSARTETEAKADDLDLADEKAEEVEAKKAEEEAAKEKAKAAAKAKKKTEEEAAKVKAAAEAKNTQEAEKAKAAAEAKKKAEEEPAKVKAKAVAEAKKKAEEEVPNVKAKAKDTAEAKKKAEEEAEKAKAKAVTEAKKRAEEESTKAKAEAKADAEDTKKAEQEAVKVKANAKAAAEAKKNAEEEAERANVKAATEAKKKAEEEAKKAKAKAAAKAKNQVGEEFEKGKAKASAEAKKKLEEEVAKATAKAAAEAKKKVEKEVAKAKSKAAAKAKKKAEEAAVIARAKVAFEVEKNAEEEADIGKAVAEAKKKAEEEVAKAESKTAAEVKKKAKEAENAEAKAAAEAKTQVVEKNLSEAKKKAEEEVAKVRENAAAKAKKVEEEAEIAEVAAEAKAKVVEEAKKAKVRALAEAKKNAEEEAAQAKVEEETVKANAEAISEAKKGAKKGAEIVEAVVAAEAEKNVKEAAAKVKEKVVVEGQKRALEEVTESNKTDEDAIVGKKIAQKSVAMKGKAKAVLRKKAEEEASAVEEKGEADSKKVEEESVVVGEVKAVKRVHEEAAFLITKTDEVGIVRGVVGNAVAKKENLILAEEATSTVKTRPKIRKKADEEIATRFKSGAEAMKIAKEEVITKPKAEATEKLAKIDTNPETEEEAKKRVNKKGDGEAESKDIVQSNDPERPRLALWDRAKNLKDRLTSHETIASTKREEIEGSELIQHTIEDTRQSTVPRMVGLAGLRNRIVSQEGHVGGKIEQDNGNKSAEEVVEGFQQPMVPRMSGLAGRAKSWRARFTLGQNNSSDMTVEDDVNTEAATAGGDNKATFPKVLFNDRGEADHSKKEPEIGSI